MREKMRRLLSILLVAALAFSMVPTALAADFNVTVSNGFIDDTDYEPEYLVTSREEMAQQVHISGWPPENVAIGETYDVTIQADSYTEDGVPCVMDGPQRFVLESVTLRYGMNRSSQDTETVKDEVWNVKTEESSGAGSGITVQVTTHEPSGTLKSPQNPYKRKNQNRLDLTWRLDPATKATPVTVKYDFDLPEGAHAYRVGDVSGVPYAYFGEDYISGDKLDGLKNTGIIVLKGAEIPCYPEGTLNGNVGLIGGVPDLDKNSSGNIIKTYYSFDGWTIQDDDGTVYTEDTMPKATSEIVLVAKWTEITDDELDELLDEEQKAVEVPFAKPQETGTDAMISQHSSASKEWSEEDSKDDALELEDDREVYYKATLSMNPLIAEVNLVDIFRRDILANRKIDDPTFASFDIKVQLDKQLEPVADNNGYVTFKFTCTFLQPRESGVIQDEAGKNIFEGGYTKDGDSYVYTVPTSILKNNPTFSIPMEWKPTTTGYSAEELTKEISLEVAATRVAGEKEAWVDTTGVITGSIDLSKAGVQETDVVSYLIAFDKTWRDAFLKENMTYKDILAAAKQMKDAMQHITLDANTVWAHVDGPEPDPIEPEWETSKSKTATNLDENFESQVTLSLPAAEKQLVSDVVFVLDKSTSATVEQQALKMLSDLKTQIDETDAKVQVGVVIFNKQANVTDFMDLSEQYDEIEDAIKQDISSGTNMHAGLLAGKEMLDNDTTVDDDRKYLIFVSDGLSYYFCEGEDYNTAYTICSLNGGNDGHGNGNCQPNSGLDCWDIKYGQRTIPDSWDTWMSGVEQVLETDYKKYQYVVGSAELPSLEDYDSEGAIPYKERENYPVNADISLYRSYQLYKELKENYHCYAVRGGKTYEAYPYGASFMNYLADGKAVSFDDIRNDIYYLLGAGSKVVDVIGEDKYDNLYYYDFDFVNDIANLKLTRGGAELEKTQIDDTTYGFGDDLGNGKYEFVLHYYENGSDEVEDEHFVWDINVPVSQFEAVALTYTVKLTKPQTADGVYGQYDEDGSENYEGLYTNNSATLYPIDSEGNKVKEEEFPKPTVSYTVSTEPVGTLHVSKYVADEDAVVGQQYTFKVTVGDKTKTVYLTNGETLKWPNIPLGTEYSIEEIDAKGYKATYYKQTGTVTETNPDVVAAVVNVPTDEGALVISKTVNGNDQDLNTAFKFTITLDRNVGEVSYSGSYSGTMTFEEIEDGKYVASTALANGQTISINNLPAGVHYTVEEAAEEGYTTTISGHDAAEPYEGTKASGEIVEGSAAVVHFTNTYDKKPVDPPTPPTPSEKYDIDVAKSVDDTRPDVGDTVTYTVKIKNTGNKKLTSIKVEDVMKKAAGSIKVDENKLPKGVKYKGDGEFTIDELATDATITIKYTYKVKSADEDETIKNTVTAKANGVSDSDDATIRVRDDDDDDDDDDDRPSKSSKSSKPKLDTEDHYAYIVGMPDGLVHPEAEITRAEVATIFYRLLTEESRKELWTKENPYSDVAADDWYNVAVSVMSNGGVIHGYPDGTFKGGSSITRAEFATIAAQFLSSKYVGSDRFTDISGHWAAEYINRAAAEGWIAGYPDGTFRPDQNITRAEAMTLVNAVLDRTPDKDHLLRNMIEWPDNMVESKWYYAQVQEATNSHEYERGSKKTVEDWTKLLEVRDWTEIERVWSDIYSSHNPGEVMAD